MIYGFLAAAYGILMSIQSAFCAQLTSVYGNWFSVLTVHFTGLLALTPFALTRWGRRTGKAPWYLYLGGTIGVINVMFTNYSITRIGMTNCNVLMLLGEILFSAILDGFGLFGFQKRQASLLKWIAIGTMILGCASIAALSGNTGIPLQALAVFFSLMRGVSLVISRQLNGQLGVRAGTGHATYMNYATGTIGAFIIFSVLGFPMLSAFPAENVSLLPLLCGVFGCFGIFLCNLSSPKLSALSMSLIVFVSETGAGLVFDAWQHTLSAPTVIGCGIVSIGMILNLLSERNTGK